MGKNLHGGAGHKKFARKHNAGPKSIKLRISEDEGELYAIVTKMLGNGMFHCHCIDNVVRLGHIRGKFSIRKRDNMVEIGKWVLVGLREWDVQTEKSSGLSKGTEKMQKCDLLEVYADMDKIKLKDTVSEDWAILEHNDVSRAVSKLGGGDEGVVFGGDMDIEHNRLVQEMKSNTAEKITLKIEKIDDDDDDDDVKIDDI